MTCKYVGKIVAWMSLGVAVLLSTGCISSHPGSSSLAYVVIENATPEAIRETTIRVFGEEFYKVDLETSDGIVFERDATRSDQARWGRYGEEGIRMRVNVTFEPFTKGGTLVRADAYVFRQRNRRTEKIIPAGRRPYQSLLNTVRSNTVTSR